MKTGLNARINIISDGVTVSRCTRM